MTPEYTSAVKAIIVCDSPMRPHAISTNPLFKKNYVLTRIKFRYINSNMGIGDKLTTAEAAEKLGKSVRHIQWLITEGRLPAEKVGRDYFINTEDLRLVTGLRRGRPLKVKTETSKVIKRSSKK
ncbi:MAG: helix-turn-helix domain-containing protein [Acidobacteriota bacterium]|nr:helix-turn-helix domain-containing protein [Acidobacteriota bacterium]